MVVWCGVQGDVVWGMKVWCGAWRCMAVHGGVVRCMAGWGALEAECAAERVRRSVHRRTACSSSSSNRHMAPNPACRHTVQHMVHHMVHVAPSPA